MSIRSVTGTASFDLVRARRFGRGGGTGVASSMLRLRKIIGFCSMLRLLCFDRGGGIGVGMRSSLYAVGTPLM